MIKVAEQTLPTNEPSHAIESVVCQERQREPDLAVEKAIRRRIEENGTFAFYFKDVICECVTGVLSIRGRVPTDRMKRVLWSLLEDLDGITEIDDHLDVISSSGLSIIHPS